MVNKFLHFGFALPDPRLMPNIDATLNGVGDDWIRYAGNNWIVWTARSPHAWFDILRPHLGPNGQLLISELNLENRAGYLSQWIWDWIDGKRIGANISTASILEALGISPHKPAEIEPPRHGGGLASQYFRPPNKK